MRALIGLVVLLSFAPASRAADAKEARRLWLRGNHAEALEAYQQLAKDDKHAVTASLGISQCLQSEGEFDKALETITTALKTAPAESQLLARQAELLYLRGRWAEAEKAAEAAIKASKEPFLARWIRAQIYRDRGDLKKADAEFRWFVQTYVERSEKDNDIKDAEHLTLVGMAGTENARWNKLADQFDFILQEVYADALKADADYWPAEYQAGMLLLEKFNRRDGLAALDKALKINPSCAEALVGKGMAALQRLEYREAERFAELALKINPQLPEALRLRADVHLSAGDVASALKELEVARSINPRDEQTLGRIAACCWLQRKQPELEALQKEVAAANPTPGQFYLVFADRLEDRRHYDEAEKGYRKARELRPILHAATTQLGLLYMRMGREKEATPLLEESFKADPFNVRVSNMRKVLRHLSTYQTLKTAHFEIRFDPKTDAVLARYLGEFLEQTYDELAKKFAHQPKGPILVEVFNNHEMFSGRTIALPDLHTIGACTGRMVAMVSPRGKGVKPFNWARVLRHELVHIFNLDQTNFLVPHWLTEGLAVTFEGMERPQSWVELLRTRVPAGNLMTLDNIDLGFMRPTDALQWSMAYCQSQLYVEYIEKTHGPGAIADLLKAYRDGVTTNQAILQVCKVDRATFEAGYRKHLNEVVVALGGQPDEKPMSFAELKQAYEKDVDNSDLAGRLAETYLRRGDRAQARQLANRVREKDKGNPRACYVLARLAMLGGDNEAARSLLEGAVDRAKPNPLVLKTLARMAYDSGDLRRAEELFELGRKAAPYDREWLTELARVHARNEDREKQIVVLKELVKGDPDNLETRRRLASLLAQAKKPAEAELYARQALEIDVLDKESRQLLLDALQAQKKDAERARLEKLLQN